MFACSLRFDSLPSEQVLAVFESLVARFAELRAQLEYMARGEAPVTMEIMVQTRANILAVQNSAVALFGIHALKLDEFWIVPDLLQETNSQ